MPSLTHPIVRAPAGSVPLPVIRGSLRTIKLSQIKPSKLNPREKADDRQGMLDLASSIEERGLLQNLVVRPIGKDGAEQYELMGGERRWHALKHLKVDEIEVKVISADDATSIATQLVENMDRRELTPMEEANAFAELQALDAAHYTTTDIAKMVGKTERFVQQRLAMAKNLSAPLKKKLEDGDITVEVARTLATLPTSLQAKLQDHHNIDSDDAADVRRAITETAIPLGRAKFDPALYTGDKLEQGKTTYCLNIDQFRQLQKVEALKVVEKLKKDWPNAQYADDPTAWHWADDSWGNDTVGQHDWQNKREPSRYLVPKDKCTAIAYVAKNGEIKVAEGVCSGGAVRAAQAAREKKRGSTTSSMGYGGSRGEKKPHKVARIAYNKAFAKALAKRVDLSSRLQLLGLLTRNNFDKGKLLPAPLRDLKTGYLARPADEAKLWVVIGKMTAAAAADVVTKLTLADTPEWGQYSYTTLPLLMNAIAETIGVAVPDVAVGKKPAKVEKAKPKAAKKRAAKSRKHQ